MPKISKQQCLNLYYYDAENNFGDQLNVDLFRYFGKQVKRKSPSKADIVAIGSLLQSFICKKISLKKKIKLFFSKPLIVYGTGFIEPDTTKFYSNRKLDIRAVRGKLSLGRLQALKNVNIPANVALGDPGLLISKMFDVSHIEKKYDLGIIPHYVDQNSPLLENISVKNSIVLDITQRPEDLLPQIASCKNILSSAMHGLIAADALLIPNMRMILSDKIVGKDYKYDDYYLCSE